MFARRRKEKQRMKGVIFDFNGTMFLDSPYHWEAWKSLTRDLFGHEMQADEYWRHYHGMPNEAILAEFSGAPLSRERAAQISEEKEARYRRACLENPADFHLTPGLPALLDALRARGVPLAIATSVGIVNLRFYFEHLHLNDWIPLDKIVYDDGTRPGKPDPAGYLEAARRLGLAPRECVGFEDSFSGVTAIFRAGLGRVFAVDGDGQGEALRAAFPALETIPDFTGLTPEALGL